MNTGRSRSLFLVMILSALWLMTAGVPARTQAQGTLEVRVKDHREAIGDFSKLVILFEEILVSARPGLRFWQRGWKSLPSAAGGVDLTRYTGTESATIFRGAVDAGSFDGIHLKVARLEAMLKKASAPAMVKNTIGPIKLPFAVRERGATRIVIDLVVLDLSDHPPRGYELGVKGYEVYVDGKLTDKVPPA